MWASKARSPTPTAAASRRRCWGCAMSDPATVREQAGCVVSAGRAVHFDSFQRGDGRQAAPVLLLHGSDGLSVWGSAYRDFARALAGDGHPALVVHYFDATGERR